MASSGDELGTYGQSPRAVGRISSKASAPVPGPSKSVSKLRKTTAPHTAEHHKDGKVYAIAISSDEDNTWTTKRGKAITDAAIDAAPNGNPSGWKGKGKATAVKRKKMNDASGVEAVEDTAAETDADVVTSRRNTRRSAQEDSLGKRNDLSRNQTDRLKKQLEDITAQRDALSTQLEEVLQLRNTDAEARLVDQRTQYEATLKAQQETIQELQSALSRVDKLSGSAATTTLHFLTRESADEELQAVRREVASLKESLQKKDKLIQAKDNEVAQLNETIRILRSDLKAEIENTKALTSRAVPPSTSKWNDSKNALVIRLYEKLTNLLVLNVTHEPGKFREDDAIFQCVQTTASGKSLTFTLKSFKDPEGGQTPASAAKSGHFVGKVIYDPMELEKESQEFVDQLGFLAHPFTFQEEQMSVFSKTLVTYIEGDIEDNNSIADQMESEGGVF